MFGRGCAKASRAAESGTTLPRLKETRREMASPRENERVAHPRGQLVARQRGRECLCDCFRGKTGTL